jgi:hypothetical protein
MSSQGYENHIAKIENAKRPSRLLPRFHAILLFVLAAAGGVVVLRYLRGISLL